jgi:hypothetical protein
MSQQAAICTTCGKPDHQPYRVYDEHGTVTAGCVDAIHDGRLVTPSESASWHARPEARRIRARLAKGRRGEGY